MSLLVRRSAVPLTVVLVSVAPSLFASARGQGAQRAAVQPTLGDLSATQPAIDQQTPGSIEVLLLNLAAPDWSTRAASTRQLRLLTEADSSLLDSETVRSSITALLQLENTGIVDRYRSGVGTSEGLSEYYFTELLPLALQLLDRRGGDDTLLAAALVEGTYNPDSPFAKTLAGYGTPVVASARALMQSELGTKRWNGLALIGEIVRGSRLNELRHPIEPEAVAELKQLLRATLQDPEADIRRHAIKAVVVAGDHEAIPRLSQMAASDPDMEHRIPGFSVRERAAAAVTTLRKQK